MSKSEDEKHPLESTGASIGFWVSTLGCMFWIVPIIAIFTIVIFGMLLGEPGYYIGIIVAVFLSIGIFQQAKKDFIEKDKAKARKEKEEEEIRRLTLEKLREDKEE